MNFDEIFMGQQGISPEKLAFLKAMSSMNTGGSAQELMAAMMSANNQAQKQGIHFTDAERDRMLETLLQNLSPEESVRARKMVQLVRKMQQKNDEKMNRE